LAIERLHDDRVGGAVEHHPLVRPGERVNMMCSLTVSTERIWSKLCSGGQPFIAQIGPPIEMSIRKPHRLFHSARPPMVAIARSRRSSVTGPLLW
jgi:hypothetical protein